MMKKWLTLSAVLAVGGLLLLRPQEAAQAVREGLALCAGTVIPSLFPFFVVVSLLLQLGLAEALQGHRRQRTIPASRAERTWIRYRYAPARASPSAPAPT